MVSIYLLEDCDGLKYVGSTITKLNVRLSGHRSDKKSAKNCSSSKLNLDNCIIIVLERCNKAERKERERYYINEIDCVNQMKLNGRDKEKQKEYREKNKEQIKEKKKEYGQLDWFCSDCKCNVKRCHKARHLKSKKHEINTNNFLSQ